MYIVNPTVSFQGGDIEKVPVVYSNRGVESIVKENIIISKTDWDFFEISWDVQRHPLLTH